jgi:hypothetical protein
MNGKRGKIAVLGFWLMLISLSFELSGQAKYTISGYIKDAENGETLVGASVYDQEDPLRGSYTNSYGFYSLTLPEGNYTLVFSFLGFAEQMREVELREDIRLNISLSQGIMIEEIVVTGKEDQNVEGTEMGTTELGMDQLKKLPALLGEVDVLKAIQLLPGVLSAGEGNSGFYVRGGGPDQNLVLLDEAVVYNSGHLLGFFSVFNPDAIRNTTLIKGGMPARYGGRLSSVVDIQMKEGNDQRWGVQGGLGALSSRLTVEGPIVRDKSSLMVSGRRAYAFQLAQPFLEGTNFEGTNYFFYDLNAKVNYRFSDKDRLFVSSYFGRDVLKYVSAERGFALDMAYGNTTTTLRWNHLFNDQLFMNLSLIYNDYEFTVGGEQADFDFNLYSGVRDGNAKLDFDFFPSTSHRIRFGAHYTYHRLTPSIATASSNDVDFSSDLQAKYAQEAGLYIQDEIRLSDRLSLDAGLRFSLFSQLGPYVSPIDSREYGSGENVKTFTGWEPRISSRFKLSPTSSLKAGFSMAWQYIHLVSNSTSTLPFDVWVPSTERVKPQLGLQYALGYFRNFGNNTYEASVEVYYKDLENQIDFRDGYVDDITRDVEENFVFGSGRAYGLELFLKKRKGDLNGWLGYTLSRSERSFPEIEEGRTFPAVYDRTHDISLVMNYTSNPKWEFGLVFVYGTGRAFTPFQSVYFIEQKPVINFGPRNSARFDAYHRLDLSATYYPNPDSQKKFTSSWNFSIYNVYNRRNPLYIFTSYNSDFQAGNVGVSAAKVSIFPIIPSVTWNFRWKS